LSYAKRKEITLEMQFVLAIGMNLMPLPTSRRFRRPLAIIPIILCLVFGGALFMEGQYVGGLLFSGIAGVFLLGVVVYSAEWFENLDQSMRIFTLIFGVSFVGGVAGFLLYGMEGAVFGWIYTLLGAQIVGAVCALVFRYRDEKETREYEREMRKYGKEP
jgi:peptidoglycan/LPS O-acetylase OafA/YrhL